MKDRSESASRPGVFAASALAASCLLGPLSYAGDPASTNFKVSESSFSGGGGGTLSSSSYKLSEGNVDHVSKEPMAGTTYKVEGKIGPSHGVANPPLIESVTPGNLARFFTDESASYTVTAKDTEAGTLEYQLKAGSLVKVPWQAANVLSYGLSAADKGRHALTFEVKDPDGVTAKNQDHYVFRRPIK
jgi:hypothetical protein